MKIKVIEVATENKGRWSRLSVKYQNQEGLPQAKDVMSFGPTKDTFLILSQAKRGDEYEITAEKNEKGYWDWVEAKKTGHSEVATNALPAAQQAPRGNFETAEERAARQILIVRQSSLATAVEYLNHNKKNYEAQEILNVATIFESFIFGNKIQEVVTTSEIQE